MNNVTYACTALNGMNKVGLLKRDEQGYAEVVLGGLDVYNSSNEFYTAKEAQALFESSGILQRRVRDGALRSENGHPKMLPGMSPEQFASRVMSIYEERVCAHIKEVTLDFNRVKDKFGNRVIAIIGKVKPAGELGYVLEQALMNPNENVAFSIRAFTDNEWRNGRVERHLRSIITWDFVGEPGISVASKYSAPSLESLDTRSFSRGQIERAIKTNTGPLATESVRLTGQELFASMGWDIDLGQKKPGFYGW